MTTRTLTALYNDHATAERAAERLRALGVPEGSIEMHRADEGDIAPGNAPSGGLFATMSELFMPDADRHGYLAGIERGCTVVVAFRVPDDLAARALDMLDAEAAEVDQTRDAGPPAADDAPRPRRARAWDIE
jgi:hypothetical protein